MSAVEQRIADAVASLDRIRRSHNRMKLLCWISGFACGLIVGKVLFG